MTKSKDTPLFPALEKAIDELTPEERAQLEADLHKAAEIADVAPAREPGEVLRAAPAVEDSGRGMPRVERDPAPAVVKTPRGVQQL